MANMPGKTARLGRSESHLAPTRIIIETVALFRGLNLFIAQGDEISRLLIEVGPKAVTRGVHFIDDGLHRDCHAAWLLFVS